ncbi:DUF2357 domain-containing protein [Desulfurobacterium sp.]
MELFFSEKGFDKKAFVSKQDLLKHLEEKEQIKIIGDTILFNNFTGILKTDNNKYLIIPKKLANIFKLTDNNNKIKEDFYERYINKFESFLTFIVRKLSRENILYTTSLFKFPVKENKTNSSKIFKLLLLIEMKKTLVNATQIILSSPHKKLIQYKTHKNLEEINHIDSEVIIDLCHHPERLYQTENGILEHKNQTYSPISVLQYKVNETYDTTANRFVKYFLKELESILSKDLNNFLFFDELREIKENIVYALQSDIFSRVKSLTLFPSSSQVLMKKPGYREIFQIYRLLHISYIPKVFKDLDLAFSLKDMATLWEYYVLVKLLEEFKKEFGNYKVEIDFKLRNEGKTVYDEAKFSFNNGLILHFQASKYAYSTLKFRPDFLIYFNNKKLVFDAKFRLFDNNKSDILKNMHYYKDGLQLDAAIAVCIGIGKEKGTFWQKNNKEEIDLSLKEIFKIVKSGLKGVGHFNLNMNIWEEENG